MTYVIALPCVDLKDKTCIEECPVDCIYEGEPMLYIHPDECVDCGACEPVCPVEAIFYEDDLSERTRTSRRWRGTCSPDSGLREAPPELRWYPTRPSSLPCIRKSTTCDGTRRCCKPGGEASRAGRAIAGTAARAAARRRLA
jgi:NAD-dependent dihydropyrimidine dehydrogenase PreA subunit